MPDIYYARVSNFLSDSRDRTIVRGDSEEEVLNGVYEYLRSDEARSRYPAVTDPTELENNIRRCIFKKGTKVFATRAPQEH